MTLTYCTSMDIYGTGSTVESGLGWRFDDGDWTVLGDLISNAPSFPNPGSFYNVSGFWKISTVPWGQRRGDFAFKAEAPRLNRPSGNTFSLNTTGSECPLFSIPGASLGTRIIHVAFSCDSLPIDDTRMGMIMSFHDNAGSICGRLGVNPTGRLVLYDGDGYGFNLNGTETNSPNIISVTGSPVVVPETWVSLNIKIVNNGDGSAAVQVYSGEIIAGNLVLDVPNATFTAMANIDGLGLLPPSLQFVGDPVDSTSRYIRDLVVNDTAGTENNDLLGQVFVAAQEIRSEDAGGGWSAESRTNISDGVLNMQDANTGLRVGDNAVLEIGAGDFTIEGFWRFHSLPIGVNEVVLASKWSTDNDQRSWRFYYDADPGEFRFDVSTDGINVTTVWVYPFLPDLDKYYHMAISRETSVIRVFFRGTQLGVDLTDANTYFDGTASFGLGAEYDSANALVTATAFDGFIDEFRLTVGLSRYNADFTPTTVPFGRDGVDDVNFANVALLMGFDANLIVDESSNALTLLPGTGVTADIPDDGTNSFQVLNRRPAIDDTYIEARNTFATTILTLTGLPLDTETVTLGSETYTFVAALTDPAVPNEVLIGVDEAACVSNLLEAVNGGVGAGVVFGSGTIANLDVFASPLPSPQVLFTATTIGDAGNATVSTETLTNGSFPAATFQFGEDIPPFSQFAIERLPVDVTGVLGMQVSARGYKSDAGDANLRFDLVGPSAGVELGAPLNTELNPAWLRQVFEIDPDTAVGITPSTITGGRIRVTRTV